MGEVEVEVSGLSDSVDNEFLILYFENKRRSGGGAIRACRRHRGVALIVFESSADAEEVLTRGEHRFNDVTVQVRRAPPWDPGKLALTGLNPQTEDSLLEMYLETLSTREGFSVWRSLPRSKALVAFQEPLSDTEMESLIKRIAARPLLGASVSAERVRATTEILVQKIGPKISADLLEMYFESHRRSGGGAVCAVQLLTDKAAAIVSFIDHQVVGNVVRREHALEGSRLLISPYYPAVLGMPWAPDPGNVKQLHHQKAQRDGIADCVEELCEDQAQSSEEHESRLKSKEQTMMQSEEQTMMQSEEQTMMQSEEQTMMQSEEQTMMQSEEQTIMQSEEQTMMQSEEQTMMQSEEQTMMQSEEQTMMQSEEQTMMQSEEQTIMQSEEQTMMQSEEQTMMQSEEQTIMQSEEQTMMQSEEQLLKHIAKLDMQFGAVVGRHKDHNLVEQMDKQLGIAEESINQVSGNKLLHPVSAQPSSGKVDPHGIMDCPRVRAVREEMVPMQIPELRFLQEYHHDLLAGMDQITIQPIEREDTTGFKVSGDACSCQTAVELLQHIVSSLAHRSVTLQYPGVSPFLLGEEGQRLLRETERLHHCIIDTSLLSWKSLGLKYVDPWRLVNDAVLVSSVEGFPAEEPPEPANELPEDMENIRHFASLITDVEIVKDRPKELRKSDSAGIEEDMEQDLYTDRPSIGPEAEFSDDDELEQIYKISRDEYQDKHLDEEAELLLAIQRSMDTQSVSDHEDKELQEALAMSLTQQGMEETEDNLQMALEMSLKDQWGHQHGTTRSSHERGERFVSMEEAEKALCTARLRVLTGDETDLVVACAALRKAIVGELCSESLEEAQEVYVQQADIILALERKHAVKITDPEGQWQIQGFSQFINSCRQELIQILKALKGESSPRQPMDLDMKKGVKLLTLAETSEEYGRVSRQFYSTLGELRQSVRVLEVQRVQNVLLHNQYELKRQSMLAHSSRGPIERSLYHGTTEASAREICHDGFNRSFCGKNAALYGQGVYFAVQSVLSTRDNYSPPSSEGKKYVLVAQVLTGEFTLGKPEMRAPPPLAETTGDVPRRYDSLADSLQNPAIFVIFNDTQAYPQYLITCCKGSGQ
ncbi:hypothetical protein XENTR_v10017456 [Xenopus tropicalis]|uniref:Poly [ADP-ribose] polymerase n=2 Tax=Xenopus tropicalis TaxID=8364 RepID=A0A8J1JPG3_XENTR|nr:protein mono-ADP-ribosyltransferase PARP10 isoform X2 [Xenopus tropicalis]KAE8600065.1 hypothetical protein XENTR_v10017456 [Xenopus tropicalis]